MIKDEILFGFHSVFEALKAKKRKFFEIYLLKNIDAFGKDSRFFSILSKAKLLNIPIKILSEQDFKNIYNVEPHHKVALRTGLLPTLDFYDILKNNYDKNLFLLILDNVLDVNNLGALIRTAVCVGIDAIILPKDKSAPLNPSVSKTSAGALEHAKISKVTNLSYAIDLLKEKNVWIVGTDRLAKDSIFALDLPSSIAVVVGGEEKGMRKLIKKKVDFLASIPQSNLIDSLNVSAAGAVVMYEIFRQRSIKNV